MALGSRMLGTGRFWYWLHLASILRRLTEVRLFLFEVLLAIFAIIWIWGFGIKVREVH
jgi:hypothetical protein